jgi:hypothetical protein
MLKFISHRNGQLSPGQQPHDLKMAAGAVLEKGVQRAIKGFILTPRWKA